MREGGRVRPWLRRLRAARREAAWLGASLVVATATIVSVLAFGSYESGHRKAVLSAEAAQLAASKVNALEWQTVGGGRLAPHTGAQIRQLLRAIAHHLASVGADRGAAGEAIGAYNSAIHVEFQLLAAGRLAAARRVDTERVDPAFDKLDALLRRAASEHNQAARTAETVATAGEIAGVGIGFAIAAALLLGFAAARRALVTAEFEQRMLRDSDKAKSDLISIVSHDLRTPLTSITGYLEFLTNGEVGALTNEQRRLLDVVQRNADRLLAIMNDLLLISRAKAGRIELTLERLSLEHSVADVVEGQRLRARQQGIDLRFSAMPSCSIMADRHRVDELVENLLSNALKFTPSPGSVDVVIRPTDRGVLLEVSDSGIGISVEDQKHLFEQFFRSADVAATPGTGLGLAITKAIADAHEASISVRSTHGKGTTFRVEFPAPDGPTVADGDPVAGSDASYPQ